MEKANTRGTAGAIVVIVVGGNPARWAYETDLTLDELRSGPCELDGEAFDWGDRSRPYQHPHYWSV